MKNILVVLLLMMSVAVLGQSFEGTLIWSIKTEITDPNVKMQMEQSKKAMSDPAKLKEMEEQMNSPQFKKMMDENPQMKAQMEKAMEMMKGAGGMESLMPSKITVRIKNQNSLTEMEGGMLAGNEILYLKDKQQSITLDRKNKTYSIHTNKQDDDNDHTTDVKVTKTSETKKILNFSCTKYIVETKVGEVSMKQNIWATKEIKDLDFKALASQEMGKNKQASFFYKEIDGVPLMVEMTTPQMHMEMTAVEIKRGSQPASSFTIPSDFKEVKGMY